MVAAEVLADPCELGIGPITGDEGSLAGAAGSGFGFGGDLQAATTAAAAAVSIDSIQNLRGAYA